MSEIQSRINDLESKQELSYDEIFDIVCQEYKLDANFFEQQLGCKCPFALIGFIEESNE